MRCARGRIFDVVVDLRRRARRRTARWEAVELDDERMRELYVPVGFAHGFVVLSEVADVIYKLLAPTTTARRSGRSRTTTRNFGIDWRIASRS